MTAPSSLQNRLRTTALYAALSLAPALGLAQGGVMNLLNSLGGGSSGGGLLGAVDGHPGPMLAAGQSRRLLSFGPGQQRLELWLPVNSFAPYSLVFRSGA